MNVDNSDPSDATNKFWGSIVARFYFEDIAGKLLGAKRRLNEECRFGLVTFGALLAIKS